MKDLLILLVLLIAQLHKVCPLPSPPDGNGQCSDSNTYLSGSNLCCSKCQPGHRLVKECTQSTDTVCEQCGPGQYMENWNYARNCFSCPKCKPGKGLEYAHNCSTTNRSMCTCKSGWYCSMGYDKPYCTSCDKDRACKVGFGVFVKGTGNSNTKCRPCVDGTFSDKLSYTDPCRPHTTCGGRTVRKGNATADTVCEPQALMTTTQLQSSNKEPGAETALTTASTVMAVRPITSVQAVTVSTQSISPSVPVFIFNTSTKRPPTKTGSGFQTAASISGVIAVLFLITIILLCLCKSTCKKDTERLHHKVDANGNSEICNEVYMDETKLIYVTSPEQQCLLERGEASSEYSQYSTNTESLPRTVGSSSHESIEPLQPTVALNNNQFSVLSEPMPLISHTNTAMSESSILTPSSPQSTSPQIINPVTTSPHVNVNITFHIGNGTCATQPVMSTDFKPSDSKLPFGEEEESFSIPQQEDGKQSLTSVQESTSYSTELDCVKD